MALSLPPCPPVVTLAFLGLWAVVAANPTTPTHRLPWDREFYSGVSQVGSQLGQWPPNYCRLTNVYFQTARKNFYAGVDGLDSLDRCHGLRNVWTFELKNNVTNNDNVDADSGNNNKNIVSSVNFRCDQVFQTGHVFTLDHFQDSSSNYIHLLRETFLPLFAALHYGRKPAEKPAKNVVLMPSVEKGRGAGTDWNTDAFLDDTAYWMEILKVVAGPYRILPLDRRLAAMQKTMCFKETMFGTPKVNYTNPEFIQSFTKFVKNRLNIQHYSRAQSVKPIVGIYISGRQRIQNEEEVIKALEPFGEVDIVNSELPFKTQVERMQRYAVLAGINGAGLMNALYLPPNSVAIQLVSDESVAHTSEYSQILKTRGPYLELRNIYSNFSTSPEDEVSNVTIHLNELKDIVQKALSLANTYSSEVPT